MTRDERNPSKTVVKSERRENRQRVVVLEIAKGEGRGFLTPGQYLHVTDLGKQLTGFVRREFESDLDIDQFFEFWELKEKGGVLGKKNVRVYFSFDSTENEIIVLCTDKKEQTGKPSKNLRPRLRNRLRLYRSGELRRGLTIYEVAEVSQS